MIFVILKTNGCQSYFLLSLILWACAGYAYHKNAKRPADDPKKKEFRRAAIILAPITLPLVLAGLISLFILKAILYCIFLVAFTIVLVAFRKPFIFVWLDKIATKIGNFLLEINTFLIKVLYNPPTNTHQQA